MKSLLAICLILVATCAGAGTGAAPAPAATVIGGEVVEVLEVESYTYLRLKTQNGETWAAVNRTPVSKGAKVTIANATVMRNFESKALKRTFQTIVFGTLAGAPGTPPVAGSGAMGAHAGLAKGAEPGDVRVAKARGANARTVAEILTNAAKWKDQPVLVSGRVVKYNPGIMGKNWIHLRDGSGSAADQTNDVLVTSMGQVKVGDIVTVKGIIRTDRDLGSGYTYKVLIEEATLQP